jgi:hypothetical protein
MVTGEHRLEVAARGAHVELGDVEIGGGEEAARASNVIQLCSCSGGGAAVSGGNASCSPVHELRTTDHG